MKKEYLNIIDDWRDSGIHIVPAWIYADDKMDVDEWFIYTELLQHSGETGEVLMMDSIYDTFWDDDQRKSFGKLEKANYIEVQRRQSCRIVKFVNYEWSEDTEAWEKVKLVRLKLKKEDIAGSPLYSKKSIVH